jgi:drug/metabolite transporter (DMT)-like permease
MAQGRLLVLTAVAMLAFAANSLFARMALAETDLDAASFTSLRLVSGALVLVLLMRLQERVDFGSGEARESSFQASSTKHSLGGSWMSAAALFVYAAGFSFAYISLPTATGALILFGVVQVSMIGYGLARGERPNAIQTTGILLAVSGLLYLLLPGASAPSLVGTVLMAGAGIGWAVYSLRGRGVTNPTRDTTGNFVRAVPMALVVSLTASLVFGVQQWDWLGVLYALLSGALASGMGYAIWYAVLPYLAASTAATVQLTVPAIAAIAGVILLSEPLDTRLVVASTLILGGVGLFIQSKNKTAAPR